MAAMALHNNSAGASVLVIGAGVAGLAAAWALHRQGLKVRVVDSLAGVAQRASLANGAQLSFSHVQPLADPGIWRQLPSLLMSRESPFAWRPGWSWPQWQWLAGFAWASRRKVSEQTTQELLTLGQLSRDALEKMLEQTGIDCLHMQSGKLVLYRSTPALDAATQQMALQAQLGCSQRVLSAQETVELEPALQSYKKAIVGALYTPSESVADCHLLCQKLKLWLEQKGVLFDLNMHVQRLLSNGTSVVGAQTDSDCLKADHYVVAAGARSQSLVASLIPNAIKAVPVYPLTGYSITLNVQHCMQAVPMVSVTDASRKLVFARLGDRLRVAGFAEIRGHDDRVDERRIEQMLCAVREVFPGVSTDGDIHAWCGHRPATPTSRPVVGRLPQAPKNLWMHTGHGMLGFTLSFGTAERLASSLMRAMNTRESSNTMGR
jgi:D-amino-acid dehydrogenase